MIDQNIIDVLACPATHRGLRPLSSDRLGQLNDRIAAGRAVYVDGEKIDRPVAAALITDNDTLIYRVDDDIPVLLVERGIAARQLIDP